MLDVIIKTNIYKIQETFNSRSLKAGIVYKDGEAVDKILFVEKNGYAVDVFNDKEYSLDQNDSVCVLDVVFLGNLIWDFMKKDQLTLGEVYVVYKRFLNDSNFINKNLEYFGLVQVEVGYKGKTEIIDKSIKYSWYKNENKYIYDGLMKIINCKNLSVGMNIDEGSKRK